MPTPSRWRPPIIAGVVLAVSLAVAAPQPAVGDATPPAANQTANAATDAGRTVTLITGDQVTLTSAGYAIRPAPGRGGMLFEHYRHDGHEYVIPVDAVEPLARGRLDLRLFDVKTLLDMGYGDADRADLPLIVGRDRAAGGSQRALAAIEVPGVAEAREIPDARATALRVAKPAAGRFWEAMRKDARSADDPIQGVDTIWLDGRRRLVLDQSTAQIGAPAAWAAGYTGAGVVVAVLDSGIDAGHPDFAGRILAAEDFTGGSDPNDTVGHGTHVASILAGSGAASGGRYRGVAPDARLLVGKVCPSQFCPESAILAGMVWAAAEGAAVINLSLGGPDTPGIDPLERAVEDLTAQTGALFVIAAGNDGTGAPVSSPASADAALAVGAVDRFDGLADFSSRGPRVGDSAIKPDVTAPGVGIVAARATDGFIGEPVNDRYTRLDGTSMATPHVAGAAALLAQEHPEWTAAELKAALMGTARPNSAYTVFEQGAGRIDVAAAIEQRLLTSPPSLSLGLQPYPHDDDEPVVRQVTYRNLGATAVTLSFAFDVTGPDGLPAPAGMFSVEPATVTVPAGGETDVTVTADTTVTSPLGLFTGALVARSDAASVRVPIGVDKEPERYFLTLMHTDRTGGVPAEYITHVQGVDTVMGGPHFGPHPDGKLTLRLPPGRYHVYSAINTRGDDGRLDVSALAQPLVTLTGDMTIHLDARKARPMTVRVPHSSARSAAAIVIYERRAPAGLGITASVAGPSLDRMYTAHLGAAVPDTEVLSAVHSQWGEPGAAGIFMDSPYAYHLAWFQRGEYWTGFDRRVRQADLAVIRAEYRSPQPERQGFRFSGAMAPEGSISAGFFFPFRLPFERTEYYIARDARWLSEFQTLNPQTGIPETVHSAPPVTYHVGHHQEQWNRAVFGPAFPAVDSATQWVYRHAGSLPSVAGAGTADEDGGGGEAIVATVPLYNDFSATHSGFSWEDSGRTALYRDGELIGETFGSGGGEFAVPDERATYRLEVEGFRPSYAELSTHVSGVWTFESERNPDAEFTVLPLLAIRFGPALDANNSAPAGRAFVLPVWVQRQAGSGDADIANVTVDVSYDDGATWQPALVAGKGDLRRAIVHHPSAGGYVSLRASAVDTLGNSVQQTIIRAYRLSTRG